MNYKYHNKIYLFNILEICKNILFGESYFNYKNLQIAFSFWRWSHEKFLLYYYYVTHHVKLLMKIIYNKNILTNNGPISLISELFDNPN